MRRVVLLLSLMLCVSAIAFAHKGHTPSLPASQQSAAPVPHETVGFEWAAYVHVLLNPFPVYGIAAGAFFLFLSLLRKKQSVSALIWLILMSVITGAAVYFGEQGYDRLFPTLDSEAQRWMNVHMERAEDVLAVFYVVGAAALASLITKRKWPRVAQALGWLTFALALSCVGLGGWISRAGGQIRHSEFRHAPAPLPDHMEHDD